MDRRTYIEGVGAVVATGAIAGCTGGNGNTEGGDNDGDTGDDGGGNGGTGTEYGVLSTSVTDQPNDIGDFESLVVTIEGIWVKPAGSDDGDDEGDEDEDGSEADDESTPTETESGGEEEATPTETDESGDENDENNENDEDGEEGDEDDDEDGENSGRYYIEFDEPQEADLVRLQGDTTQLIDETELEVAEYQFLQLNVAGTNGVLENGSEASVETPGNAPLQFKQAFEIRADETTRFIADFAPFKRGNGSYLIRPVASGTQVLYGDEEADDAETGTDPEETDEEGTNETEASETDDADGGRPDDAGAGNGGDGS